MTWHEIELSQDSLCLSGLSPVCVFLSGELCSQAPVDKEIVVAGGFRDELEVK